MQGDGSHRPGKSADELERLLKENEELLALVRSAEDCRDRYASLYDLAPVALLTLDRIGTIYQANQGAHDLLAPIDGGPVLDKRLKWFTIREDQPRLAAYLRSSASPHAGTCAIRLKRLGGEPVPIHLWSRHVTAQASLFHVVMLDLREQQQEAHEMNRLREAEGKALAADEAKDQFIAVLSHELRTPLTPILAAVSSLATRADVPPPYRQTFEMIRRNVVAEARLIDDLLDVTRIARGKVHLEPVVMDVHEAARQALELLMDQVRAKGLTVDLALEADRHWITGDPLRFQQVFWNLLRNAVKFSLPSGRIQLRSWDRRKQDGNAGIVIEIADAGAGIDPNDIPRLFRAFEQDPDGARLHGGLGLGLPICKGLVELHGGRLSAHSPGRGKGARFVLELPTSVHRPEAPPSAVPGVELPADQSARRCCILLVEDDPDTSAILSDILEAAGHEVRTAGSIRAALAATLEGVDLIVSDIGLPDGNGLELMRRLRASQTPNDSKPDMTPDQTVDQTVDNKVELRAIALSGYGTEMDRRASLDAGFLAHLTKPIEVDQLLRLVRQLCESPDLTRASPP